MHRPSPRNRLTRHVSRVALVLAALAAGGCPLLYAFDRGQDVVSGSIRGETVLVDEGAADRPVGFVRVDTLGARTGQRSDSEGRFVVNNLSVGNWILRLSDDRDGNGWPERTMTVTTRLVAWSPPSQTTPLARGDREPIGLDLGAVRLAATFPLKGSVLVGDLQRPPDERGLLGRVFVLRQACLLAGSPSEETPAAVIGNDACPDDVTTVAEAIQLGAESWAPVDGNGDFAFPAVSSGKFAIVAMVFGDPGFDAVGEPLLMSTPLLLSGEPPDEGVQFEVGVISLPEVGADAPALNGTREVEIVLAPDPDYLLAPTGITVDAYVMQTLPDRRSPPCVGTFPVEGLPGYPATRFVDAGESVQEGDRVSLRADLHQGIWDVRVCAAPEGTGGLEDIVILPPDGSLFTLGPVRLTVPAEQSLDRDTDEVPGLPDLTTLTGDAYDDAAALWQACSAACASAEAYEVDPQAGTAVCSIDVDGDGQLDIIDCDDDGDSQPDVTEDPRCVEVGRGADWDADGLCGAEDPFPYCSANQAPLCLAGQEQPPSTTLSSAVAEPPCAPITLPGARFCEVAGENLPGGPADCSRFSMVCERTGIVEAECLLGSDCGSGICELGRCFDTRCDPELPGSCGDEVCTRNERVCLPSCAGDQTCAGAETCREDTLLGTPPACYPAGSGREGAACDIDAQCADAFVCVDSCSGSSAVGVDIPESCSDPAGSLYGQGFCQRECVPGQAGGCRPDQQCLQGLTSGISACWFPAVDLTCECRDALTGNVRKIRSQAVLEDDTCSSAGVRELWQDCAGFMNDPGAPGMFPPDPDPDPGDAGPDPDPEPSMDGGPDDAGIAIDAGTPPMDAGLPDAGEPRGDAGSPDAGTCEAEELCWNGFDDDCSGSADDGCPIPSIHYPSLTFFEGRPGAEAPLVDVGNAPSPVYVSSVTSPLPSYLQVGGATGLLTGIPEADALGTTSSIVDVTVGTYPTLNVPVVATVLPPLHAYWTFDSADHAGVVMADRLGVHDLAYSDNSPPAFGLGIVDNCVGLFTWNSYSGAIDQSSRFAASIWFRTSNVTLAQVLVDNGGDMTSSGWQLMISGGAASFLYKGIGLPVQQLQGPVAASTWTHVVISYDAGGQARLWIGTQSQALVPVAPSAITPSLEYVQPTFIVGSNNNGFNPLPYSGELDELYIFDAPLEQAMAAAVHQRGMDGLDLGWQ